MNRYRPAEETGSPKKQARVVMSPEMLSRKRTRLEDQLSDIQYIDCNTPETISTTAVIHTLPEPQKPAESYQPKNKSPRNSSSETETKRQSLNLETIKTVATLPKSLTDTKLLVLNTPQSPIYQPLADSSTATSSPDFSPTRKYENVVITPYENVLTTISITYKSVNNTDSIYEDVNPEKAVIPTSDASLPIQEATQPNETSPQDETDLTLSEIVHHSSTENLTKTSIETPSSTISANVSDFGDKRKSFESETFDDDASVYQQVKYFRRSIHEINALLELDNVPSNKTDDDSLENTEIETTPCVKDLKSVFESPKNSLPPCLRARNIKNQTKTRSLDENEFKKECGTVEQRRKSMDETINTPPKILNQPKEIPRDDGKLETLHLSHSVVIPSDQLRRDRIEKYKEARRKFLQDKYRSESFKEDKDVLLSRLKVFRKNCDESSEVQSRLEDLSLKVRRSKRNNNKDEEVDSLEEEKGKKEENLEDFLREKSVMRSERRRHTYDSRERETETDRVRRISLENKSPRWVL